MKIKVGRIFKNDTDKDGVKLISKKYGKPYFKIDVYAEGSDEKMTAFANNTNDAVYNMEVGGTYSIAIEEKTVGDRVYKNFRMLTPQEVEIEDLRAFKASQGSGLQTENAATPIASFEPTNEVDSETNEGVF